MTQEPISIQNIDLTNHDLTQSHLSEYHRDPMGLIMPELAANTNGGNPVVIIYVNSSIYTSIASQITQYELDIATQGYNVSMFLWSNTDVNILKANITNYYQYGLGGIILVGDLPYALAQYWDAPWGMYRIFPSDLFLMDLDGQWSDVVMPNGLYDIDMGEHTNGTGDWEPEIWLGRINPNSIGMPGVNYTQELMDYFDRNHDYRMGDLNRSHKACLYIDDDWSAFYNDWISNFTAYTDSELDSYYTNSYTNATDYMSQINQSQYEFVHLLVHSFQTYHTFGPMGNGNDGIINYEDIWTNSTYPLFYNLYACYSCDYTQQNNTGTTYLFSNDTLCVIGSSRSGGMDLYQPFYDNLTQNVTIGQSFANWFYNPEIEQLAKTQLYYGMTILGDPLLTVLMNDNQTSVVNDSITIASPNSSTPLMCNSTYEIQWSWEGNFTNIGISLHNASGHLGDVVSNTPNGGSYNWTIPTTLYNGTDYSLQIYDIDGEPTDTSTNFTIENPTLDSGEDPTDDDTTDDDTADDDTTDDDTTDDDTTDDDTTTGIKIAGYSLFGIFSISSIIVLYLCKKKTKK